MRPRAPFKAYPANLAAVVELGEQIPWIAIRPARRLYNPLVVPNDCTSFRLLKTECHISSICLSPHDERVYYALAVKTLARCPYQVPCCF
jgi:hypothetical protein